MSNREIFFLISLLDGTADEDDDDDDFNEFMGTNEPPISSVRSTRNRVQVSDAHFGFWPNPDHVLLPFRK